MESRVYPVGQTQTRRLQSVSQPLNLESTRKAFAKERSYRRRQVLMVDEFNVIFYGDKSNKVAAYLIIPRLPQLVAKAQFGASIHGTNGLVSPLSDLQRTITELDAAYPPLLK